MKILAINWEDLKNPQAGGAEVHLQEILKRIARKGHQVTLLCSSFPGAKPIDESDGVRIIRKGSRYSFNLVAPFIFKALLREQKWDIVIEDINKIPFYTPLYHRHPLLVVIPHLFANTVFKEINFILGLYIYLSEKPIPAIYKGFKFMVISESTKEDLVKRGVRKDDVFVIKCGIDQDLYQVDPQVEKYQTPTVIYLGRLKKYKSIEHLLTGFSLLLDRIPEARLVIVGDGDYKDHLMHFAKKLNLENQVEFTGYVERHEKVKRLQKSWVAVYPSLKEGWGLTNIEANACGTPVIASNVPGLKDSVIDGKTGLLFEYGNVQELSQCMIKILSDKDYRENLIRGGLSWAKNFSWDEAATTTLELIEQIIKEESVSKNHEISSLSF